MYKFLVAFALVLCSKGLVDGKPNGTCHVEKAIECSGHGTYDCSTCTCEPSYWGKHCECSSDIVLISGCVPYGQPDAIMCSGRGQCICNKCECDSRASPSEIISGAYCECDNFSCPYFDGLICSGHGVCACGHCQCEQAWVGRKCEIEYSRP